MAEPQLSYRLVSGTDAVQLERRVSRWRTKGFEIYGDPFVFKTRVVQAMIVAGKRKGAGGDSDA